MVRVLWDVFQWVADQFRSFVRRFARVLPNGAIACCPAVVRRKIMWGAIDVQDWARYALRRDSLHKWNSRNIRLPRSHFNLSQSILQRAPLYGRNPIYDLMIADAVDSWQTRLPRVSRPCVPPSRVVLSPLSHFFIESSNFFQVNSISKIESWQFIQKIIKSIIHSTCSQNEYQTFTFFDQVCSLRNELKFLTFDRDFLISQLNKEIHAAERKLTLV